MRRAATDLLRIAQRIDELPGQIVKASARAVSAAARQGRTLIARKIRAEAAFPARYVSGKLFRRPAGEGAWEIGTPRQDGVPVVVYPHRAIPGGPRGKGWRVQLTPGAWLDLPAAFAVIKPRTLTRYGSLLFERQGRTRLPIEPVSDQSVSDVFESVKDEAASEIRDILATELARQLELLKK